MSGETANEKEGKKTKKGVRKTGTNKGKQTEEQISSAYPDLLEHVYATLPQKVFSSERFEIPQVSCFSEGNYTIIRNMDEISEVLRRDKSIIVKFLSKELAAPITIEGNRTVINGRFRGNVLNERIADFTKRFVLCKECKKPDTKLVDVGRQVKMLICEACGARAPAR
ncbi:MAG: translation initiation factor IF-2 subunit beta [Candidatus Micrarchaeia archaeon]